MKDQHLRTLIFFLLSVFVAGIFVACGPNSTVKKDPAEESGVDKQFRDRMETMAKKMTNLDHRCTSGIGMKASKADIKTWIDTIDKVKIETAGSTLGEFDGNDDAHIKPIAESRTVMLRKSFMTELLSKTKPEEKKALDLDILQAFLVIHSEDDSEHKISMQLYDLVQAEGVPSCMIGSKMNVSNEVGTTGDGNKVHFGCGMTSENTEMQGYSITSQDNKLMVHYVKVGDNQISESIEMTCSRPFLTEGFQAGSDEAKKVYFSCSGNNTHVHFTMKDDKHMDIINSTEEKSQRGLKLETCKMSTEFFNGMAGL